MRHLFVSLMILGFTACAGNTAPPVTVKGGDMDLMAIAGTWYGVYEGIESKRKGSIHFELVKGTRMAEGKVIMNADKPELATTLKIKFVSVGGRNVKGKIGPYTDPGCKCQVETTFIGTHSKNKITGTFVTQVVGKDIKQNGKWSVVRKSE